MSYFFQFVVSGVVVGSIYALAALGLVLVYKSSRVANFAHGQIIAAGAFITFFLTVRLGVYPSFFPFWPPCSSPFFWP
jgi:branched-chain amino acid transport system permease protein